MKKKTALLDQNWLDQVREAPIDPARPIIDSYHHVWKGKRGYPYMMDDLARDVEAGHNVVGSVFVTSSSEYRTGGPEHLKPVGETEWIHRLAEDYEQTHPRGAALCAGIVGQVDFQRDPSEVDEALMAHKAASHRFRGVRQSATWSDDDEINSGRPSSQRHLLRDASLRSGLARLAKHDLSLDAYVFHDQLPELFDLAKALADTPIVCVHLGGPLGQGSWAHRRESVWQDWQRNIKDLAGLPNMHIKLCGPAMPWMGFNWDARSLPPSSDEMFAAIGRYHEHAIESFSPARCMFESNFPVDKQSCAYVPLWNTFKKTAALYSDSERADLLCNTAKRFYRLELSQHVDFR